MKLKLHHLIAVSLSANLCAQDINDIEADLVSPITEKLDYAPGIRVFQTHPEYKATKVHHTLYLPTNWKPNTKYPVIFEYTGNGGYKNKLGDVCTGKVEGASLGYGISGGTDYIWVVLPYLNEAGTENVTKWWGNPNTHKPDSTITYAKKTVPWICENYGGDPNRIILTGFSRGSIACNYIGLHDDEIAKLWTAFICYSHYDGVITRWPYPKVDRNHAIERLGRLGDRPQYIISESGIEQTREFIASTGIKGNFTYVSTGFKNHNDKWILRPSPARTQLRDWVSKTLNKD